MQNLRRKPTFNELINYLEFEQPKIKYPNRDATFLRNSPYLSQFDGDSWIDLEEQENNITKEKLKEEEVKKIVSENQSTAQVERVKRIVRVVKPPKMRIRKKTSSRATYYDMAKDDDMFDTAMDESMTYTANDLDVAAAEQADEIMQKQQQMKKKVAEHLDDSQPKDIAHQMASSSNQPMEEELEKKKIRVGHPLITFKTNLKESKDRSRSIPPVRLKLRQTDDSDPMIVNSEGTQQRRSKSLDTPSERKKRNADKTLLKALKNTDDDKPKGSSSSSNILSIMDAYKSQPRESYPTDMEVDEEYIKEDKYMPP